MSQDPRELVTALNLYVLQTISQIARDDLAGVCLRFGISEKTAKELAGLNTAQLFEMSRSPRFFFSVNEELVVAAVKDIVTGVGYSRMHQSIVSISELIAQQGEQDE